MKSGWRTLGQQFAHRTCPADTWSIRVRASAGLDTAGLARVVWLVRLAVTVLPRLQNGSMRRSADRAAGAWHNWAGNVTAQPRRWASPGSA